MKKSNKLCSRSMNSPEAYRLKFRTCQINEDEGYVEFMRSKERLFNKWVTAKNVGNDYNKLRQLILPEELKHCAHQRVKTFLVEQDPNDINMMPQRKQIRFHSHTNCRINKMTRASITNIVLVNNLFFQKKTVQSEVKQGTLKQSIKPVKYCTFCKRRGHIETECYSKRRRDNKNRSTPAQCAVYPKHLHTPMHAPHTPPLEAETDNMVNIPHIVDNKVV